MNLAFFTADTLGMTLFSMPNGTLKGDEYRTIPFGPFKVDIPVGAVTDVMSTKEIAVWYTLGRLQTYVIVRDRQIFLAVLNSDTLKKKAPVATSVESSKERMKEVFSAIHRVFIWDGSKWYGLEQEKFLQKLG